MKKISVLIITKNEEHHIVDIMRSLVDFADEIVIIDSYSTDNTAHLAISLGARVIYREFDYYAAQKNWGLEQLKNNWVLVLDADERPTFELKEEIKTVLSSSNHAKAYWVERINFFMNKKVRYCGWQNDKVIRFFDKNCCKYNDKQVHEEIETNERVRILKGKLEHYTYNDFSTYFKKFYNYSSKKAIEKFKKKERATFVILLLKPFFTFLNRYIFKLGILDGFVGIVISYMASFQDFLVCLKLWRMRNGEKF